MQKCEIKSSANDVIFINGAVTFANVVQLWHESSALVAVAEVVKIDLGKVSYSDSSILALISSWMRLTRQQNKQIFLYNVSSQLKDIIRVSGLDTILPLVNA